MKQKNILKDLTDSQKQEIVDYYNSNYTINGLGKLYGFSDVALYKVLKYKGIKVEARKKPRIIVDKKVCRLCNIEKSILEFTSSKTSIDLHESKCKGCVKKINKEYKTKHKDRLKIKGKKWHEDNREHTLKKKKEYREANRNLIKAKKKKWDEENVNTICNFRTTC